MATLEQIKQRLYRFRDDRDWTRFHNPKNLAASISIEANELLEHFQWLDEPDSRELATVKREEIADDLADVAMYLIYFAHDSGIDLLQAIENKMKKNAVKYPV